MVSIQPSINNKNTTQALPEDNNNTPAIALAGVNTAAKQQSRLEHDSTAHAYLTDAHSQRHMADTMPLTPEQMQGLKRRAFDAITQFLIREASPHSEMVMTHVDSSI